MCGQKPFKSLDYMSNSSFAFQTNMVSSSVLVVCLVPVTVSFISNSKASDQR